MTETRADWEQSLALSAVLFTVSTPVRGRRERGQRMSWTVTEHPTLSTAVTEAARPLRVPSLIYAVDASGASAPLSPGEIARYLALRGEQMP